MSLVEEQSATNTYAGMRSVGISVSTYCSTVSCRGPPSTDLGRARTARAAASVAAAAAVAAPAAGRLRDRHHRPEGDCGVTEDALQSGTGE